jgi:hypothetical protein
VSASAIIERRSLRHPGTGAQALANEAYFLAARGLAHVLGRHSIVRSIYLRRGSAAGEVRFGRSDIDLTIVLHDGCASSDGARQLYALNRAVRRLRVVFPWLGECEVYAADELAVWAEVESYRVTLDVNNAVILFGAPVTYPQHPISRRQAAYRTVFWFEKYLPIALRSRHAANLRKFAIEAWMTASLAVGRADRVRLTRAETLAAWHADPVPVAPPEPHDPVDVFWRAMAAMTAEVHAALLPPVEQPSRIATHLLVLPPSGLRKTLLVGSTEQLAGELGRLPQDAMVFTPEALALYLEFMNPALHAWLPVSLLPAGISAPSVEAWRDALLRWSCPVLARNPGFGSRVFSRGPYILRHADRLSRTLEGGRPAKVTVEDLAVDPPPALRTYFLRDYPDTYALARATQRRLAAG